MAEPLSCPVKQLSTPRPKYRPPRLCHYLELDWLACLLLDDVSPIAELPCAEHVVNLELDEIAATKLAVDREIEKCAIP